MLEVLSDKINDYFETIITTLTQEFINYKEKKYKSFLIQKVLINLHNFFI